MRQPAPTLLARMVARLRLRIASPISHSDSQAAISPMGIVKPTLVMPSRDEPVAMARSGKEAV